MAFSWPTTVRTTVRRCATPPTTVSFCSRVAPPLRIHGRAYFNNDNNSNRGTTTTTTTTLLMSTTNTNNNNSNKPPGIPSYRRRRRLQRQRSDNIGGDSFDPSLVGETTLDGSTSTKEYYARPVVQWYPGHIAKAERALAETIRAVDVVIEVRDARVPLATRHSMVAAWCQNTPRIVVCTRADAISNAALTAWRTALEHLEIPISTTTTVSPPLENNSKSEVVAVRFLDAQTGTGVHGLIRAVTLAGAPVHARRTSRGLLARPLRVGILGYPNVGKSTLINRIIGGKKRCRTANIPGVTRSLQWIRVRSDSTTTTSTQRGREFEVLDSPGIIPASLTDQSDAMLVAACNCIGEKAYDNQAVATHLCATLLALHRQAPSHIIAMSAPQWRQKCIDRYRFDPLQPPESLRLNDNVKVDETAVLTPKSAAAAAVARGNAFTGDDFLFAVADATCQGNPEDAARKILQDFRTGRMGPICLQIPPQQQQQHSGMPTNSPTAKATVERSTARSTRADETNGMTLPRSDAREEKQRSAEQALATAKARGLVLPNSNNNNNNNDVEGDGTGEQTVDVTNGGGGSSTTTIGKGLFDGW